MDSAYCPGRNVERSSLTTSSQKGGFESVECACMDSKTRFSLFDLALHFTEAEFSAMRLVDGNFSG